MLKMKDRLKSWLSRLPLNRSVTIPVTSPLTYLLSNLSSLKLGALGLISHFRDIPRQDGTLLSAVGTEGRPLQNGRCYVLDGVNDKVTFATPSEFSGQALNSFDCTLSAWAKFDSISSFEALVCLGSFDLEIAPTSATEVGIWVNNAAYGGAVYAPTMGQWNHYTATKSGNTYTLYVDGVQIGQNVDADNGTIGGSSFLGTNSTTNYFHGSLYDARIYNTTLTAAQVATVLGGGDVNGLVAHYKCDEQSGLTAYDSSGNGNHGTVTNATLSSFHGTQGEYSFQNQVGYSRAFATDDTLIVAGLTLTTINFTIDLMGETGGFILFSDSDVEYLFAVLDGAIQPHLNSPNFAATYIIDGVAFPITHTRGDLYNLLSVSGPHEVEITLSGASQDLYYGGSTYAGWAIDGQVITNVVVNGIAYDGPTYLPRNESTPSQDVLGNALQHRGQAKLIAKARENACGTFDGVDDYVTLPSLTNAYLTSNIGSSGTVAISILSTDTTPRGIYSFGTTGGGNWVEIRFSLHGYLGGNYRVTFAEDNSSIDTGITPKAGVKQTIIISWDSSVDSNVRIYDGTDLAHTSAGRSPVSFNGDNSWLGQAPGLPPLYTNGGLFDFRIYDAELSTSDRALVADNQKASIDPIVHLPLSEGAGTVIHDISPNANHGTATNITQSSFWGSTQDEYAKNFVDGFTPYFTEDDTLIVAGQTLTSISFDIDLMGETDILMAFSDSDANYLFYLSSTSSSTILNSNFGTCTYTVDGVAFSGTRAELFTLLSVLGPHAITISTSISSDLYYGGWAPASTTGVDGQVISNVVVNGVSYEGPTRVPAKSSTLDAYGNALTNPASPTHNDFEGVIDYREVGVLDATPPALDHIYTGAAEFDGVSGSYASVPDPLGSLGDFTMQFDGLSAEVVRPAGTVALMGQFSNSSDRAFFLRIHAGGVTTLNYYLASDVASGDPPSVSTTVPADTVGIRLARVGTAWTISVDTGTGYNTHATGVTNGGTWFNATGDLKIGTYSSNQNPLTGQIGQVRIWTNGTASGDPVLDIDFRKFNHRLRADYATSGQLVTLNGGVTFPKVVVPDALAYDDTYPKDYCEFDGVSGSYVSVPSFPHAITDFVMEARDVYMADWSTGIEAFLSKWDTGFAFILRRSGTDINLHALYDGYTSSFFAHGLTGAATASIRLTRVGTSITAELDSGSGYTIIGTAQTVPAAAINITTDPLEIGSRSGGTADMLTGKIGSVKLTSSGTAVLDVDFSTANARNNLAETGQILTYNGGAAIPLSTLANPMFQRDDSWTRLFEVGLNDSDAAKQI